jgi:hypothetical protein
LSRKPVGFDDPLDRNFLHGVVEQFNPQLNIRAKEFTLCEIPGEAGETSECIAREYTSKMAKNIAFVIILGGLDQYNAELSAL